MVSFVCFLSSRSFILWEGKKAITKGWGRMITSKASSLIFQEPGKIILDEHQTYNTAKKFYCSLSPPLKDHVWETVPLNLLFSVPLHQAGICSVYQPCVLAWVSEICRWCHFSFPHPGFNWQYHSTPLLPPFFHLFSLNLVVPGLLGQHSSKMCYLHHLKFSLRQGIFMTSFFTLFLVWRWKKCPIWIYRSKPI